MFIPDTSTVTSLCFNWEPENNIQARLAKGPTNDRELSEVPKDAAARSRREVSVRCQERFVGLSVFAGV